MSSIKFSVSFLLVTFCLLVLNAPWVHGQTYPGALAIAKHYLSKARLLKGNGAYTFYNIHTSSYLQFTSTGNIVNPGPAHQKKPTSRNYFNVELYHGKNYTIQKQNAAHHTKCLSVAWFKDSDNTAMMYACAPVFLKRSSDEELTNLEERTSEEELTDLEERSSEEELTNLEERSSEEEQFNNFEKRELRRDKVEWVFLPVAGQGRDVYLVVSTVHMWNLYPVCLADKKSGTLSKHMGMDMLNCPRRLDKRFLWRITKV